MKSPASRLPLRDAVPRALEGINVLLVEDDHDSLALMKLAMEYQGAVVVSASDAAAALGLLAGLKPDVLVTDIMMPGYDGWWLITQARNRGQLEGVPTLAVTALQLKPQQVQQGGFTAYLRKPLDPHVLCLTVDALARGQEPRSAA